MLFVLFYKLFLDGKFQVHGLLQTSNLDCFSVPFSFLLKSEDFTGVVQVNMNFADIR